MATVVISGANRGIGLELARQYLAAGDAVIAGVRDPGGAAALRQLGDAHPGKLRILPLDVADDGSVEAFAAALGETPVDIVIANAGVGGGEKQMRLGDLDFTSWLRVINVNTLGPVRLAGAMAGALKRGSGKKLAAITSQLGSTEQNGGGMFAYRSSKAALNNAWKGISIALKDDGVSAVVLHPGWVKTDMGGKNAHLTPEQSVSGLREVIAKLKPGDTGRYLNYDGAPIPW